jgi:hypothetical protein
MNRLDKHVGLVRSKLTTERFLMSLGYSIAAFLAVVLIAVLVDRFFWIVLPHHMIWFWSAAGAAVLVSIIHAMIRRPTPHQAAAMIDEALGLKEKFSTALYARAQGSLADPFVMAAIRDAEQTADNVSVHRRFPIAFPKSVFAAMGAAMVVFLVWMFVGLIDLFDRHAKAQVAKAQMLQRQEAQREAQHVLTAVNSLPSAVKAQEKVELAKKELEHVMQQPGVDPSVMKLTAKTAEEEAKAAQLDEIKNSQKFAQALSDEAVFKSLNPSADDHGPVADASKDLANGDLTKAIDKLQGLPAKFDEMNADQQKDAVKQMGVLAHQLQKLASDPAAMQNLQKQLQQQGITPQQVQQAANLAQQAAQGNPQAAQQLQQMQQQMTQQMNGGKGPTQQQQQAISKAMQQMQSLAKTQTTAQQMTSAAQQMVQGMQMAQAAKQGGSQAGQQQATAKSASAQTAGSKPGGQTPSGKQGGNQQANAQQPGAQQPGGQQGAQQGGQQPGGQQPGQQAGQQGGKQPGQQPGQQQGGQQPGQQAGQQPGGQQGGQQPGGQQPGGQNAQQQMQQAGQQMAQALGEMDAVKKDAEQMAAAQNAADGPGDDPNNPGGPKPQPGGQGPGGFGPNQGKGNGMGGPGIGAGGVGQKQVAAYTVKQEMDPSQNIAGGKVLAKSFVKAEKLVGKSTIELSRAEKQAVKESTDDVSEETVPKDAQKAVKDYFDTVGNGN